VSGDNNEKRRRALGLIEFNILSFYVLRPLFFGLFLVGHRVPISTRGKVQKKVEDKQK
jgi:hypothetical protein